MKISDYWRQFENFFIYLSISYFFHFLRCLGGYWFVLFKGFFFNDITSFWIVYKTCICILHFSLLRFTIYNFYFRFLINKVKIVSMFAFWNKSWFSNLSLMFIVISQLTKFTYKFVRLQFLNYCCELIFFFFYFFFHDIFGVFCFYVLIYL